MSGWQPIETAPENERVLCFARNWEAPCVLILTRVYGPTIQHQNNVSGDGLGRLPVTEWRDGSGDSDQDYQPTHWMRWELLSELEQCTQCGAEIIGHHACPGLPGENQF